MWWRLPEGSRLVEVAWLGAGALTRVVEAAQAGRRRGREQKDEHTTDRC